MTDIPFIVNGRAAVLCKGWDRPGVPPLHITTAAGLHLSAAYPEHLGRPSVLFDLVDESDPSGKNRAGFRLFSDTGEVYQFRKKGDYWKARDAAGWPAMRRRVTA